MAICAAPKCFAPATVGELCAPCDVEHVRPPAPTPETKLKCPPRPCANCRRQFQPTVVRRMLCTLCFTGKIDPNAAMRKVVGKA